MQFISRKGVAELLTAERAIELMKRALVAAISPDAVQPPRWMIELRDGAILGIMPGAIDEPPSLGAKVTAVFPSVRRGSLPSHQGLIILFDSETGEPQAVVNGAEITARRTAAVSAVATHYLARPDVQILLVVGTGEQARAHVEAVSKVRTFERVIVWGRDAARATSLAEDWYATHHSIVDVAPNLEEVVPKVDVICTVTAAREPIVFGSWIRKGTHLNVVGSSDPNAAEVDTDLVALSRLFVDRRDAVEALAGEWRNAQASGRVGKDHIVASLGEVIAGRHPGRQSAQETTLFKSVGLNAEDLVAADWVAREATKAGLGQEIDIEGK